jgi:hypothetical protein
MYLRLPRMLKKAICLKLRIHDRPINTGSKYSSTVLCHTTEHTKKRVSTEKPRVKIPYDYTETARKKDCGNRMASSPAA